MLSTSQSAEPTFRVLHESDGWSAVVKPCRLLVHRTDIDYHEPYNLRDLINKTRPESDWLQPVHRLDKPTSGIVLFATKGDALNALKLEFVHRRTEKTYFAVVRGWTEDEGIIEKPLPTAHSDKPKEARTAYRTLARCTINHPVGPYKTARYSLVECTPSTGRFHQIRLHFRHLLCHLLLNLNRYLFLQLFVDVLQQRVLGALVQIIEVVAAVHCAGDRHPLDTTLVRDTILSVRGAGI